MSTPQASIGTTEHALVLILGLTKTSYRSFCRNFYNMKKNHHVNVLHTKVQLPFSGVKALLRWSRTPCRLFSVLFNLGFTPLSQFTEGYCPGSHDMAEHPEITSTASLK